MQSDCTTGPCMRFTERRAIYIFAYFTPTSPDGAGVYFLDVSHDEFRRNGRLWQISSLYRLFHDPKCHNKVFLEKGTTKYGT